MILGVFLFVEELPSFKNARKFESEEIKSNKKNLCFWFELKLFKLSLFLLMKVLSPILNLTGIHPIIKDRAPIE